MPELGYSVLNRMLNTRPLAVKKRPLLRYHGGKWRIASWIISHFPEHRIYTEAFGGGGSVLLRKPRAYAEVYNDLDSEIVNLFKMARDRGEELRRALELTPHAREEFYGSYEPSDDPLEQARRTVVRSFLGYGSNSHIKRTGYRNSANRANTTPAHDWMALPNAYPWIIDRLRGIVIENRDAVEVITAQDTPGTLHYVDPPYVPESRDKGEDYRYEMDADGHRTLAEALHRVKGKVVISGYPSDLYNELYKDWRTVSRVALADGARKRTEVLWMNF